MAKKSKKSELHPCPICKASNEKENAIHYNRRYYCKKCYDKKMEEIAQKEAEKTRKAAEKAEREAKKAEKAASSEDYKVLISYVCELYQIDAPTPIILKQIKEYKDQYGFTYKGMKSTLNYFYEIREGNDPANSMGVGIIPYVYDEAKQFYVDKKAVKDSVLNCNMEEIQNNKQIIQKRNNSNKNGYKNKVLIDIEKI